MDEKERIITAKLCTKKIQHDEKLFSEPLIGSIKLKDMIIEVEEVKTFLMQDYEFDPVFDSFKYRGVIGLDLTDKSFQLKGRILGVQVPYDLIKGCNFIRVQYMCEKMFRFEHEN